MELSLEDIEFIKILANSDSTILRSGMNDATLDRLNSHVGIILQEYYRENTMDLKTGWTEKFEEAGISEMMERLQLHVLDDLESIYCK